MSEEALQQLLDGQVVPVKYVDFQHQLPTRPGGVEESYKPIVKRTVTYIVMGLVFDDQGRMVLIQEAKQSCRGLWYIPAGRVEPGENLVEAAKREVLEEAGIEFEPLSVTGIEIQGFMGWYRICYIGKQTDQTTHKLYLQDGVKREVLEEAGLQIQPLSLISVTQRVPDRTRVFMKFFYLSKVTGGQLKTLAQKDEESLQAKWFTIKEIMSGQLQLRHMDFVQSMERAIWYKSQTDESRHPALQVCIQPHKSLLHRMVIGKQAQDGSLEVLYNMEQECLPCIRFSPRSHSLDVSLQAVVSEVFGVKEPISSVTIRGMLTLEHCGIPAREHDGLCITTVTVIPNDVHKLLENIVKSGYQWHPISNSDLLANLRDRISSNKKLVKLFQS